MQNTKREGGFVGIIILIIIGLILLKYFINFDIFQAANSTRGQETLGYTAKLLETIWGYLRSLLFGVFKHG